MRKLLLLNNLLLILSLGKCGSDAAVKTNEGMTPTDSLTMIADSLRIDSANAGMGIDSAGQSAVSDTLSKNSKYTEHKSNPKEAPKHNAPDQAKIDSIKAEKGKRKK
jgi:hypothetical protein